MKKAYLLLALVMGALGLAGCTSPRINGACTEAGCLSRHAGKAMGRHMAPMIEDVAQQLEGDLAFPLSWIVGQPGDDYPTRLARVAGRWPNSPYAGAAMACLATLYEEEAEWVKAEDAWSSVVSHMHTNAPIPQIAWRVARVRLERDDYEGLADIMSALAKNHGAETDAVVARLVGGRSYLLQGRPNDAVRILQPFYDSVRYSPRREEIAEGCYWLAESYLMSGNEVMAYRSWKQLTWNYPQAHWSRHARWWLNKLAAPWEADFLE
ncbi:hypothetical protein ACFLQU_04905 [Verrucomicrobiota bacterium]